MIKRTIDVHNHLYPQMWLDHLAQGKGSLRLERKGNGKFVFYYNNQLLATINRAGHYDPEARIADMDQFGMDVQVMSLTTPSVELVSREEGILWAKKINDYYATVCQKYPGRLYACATLPYQDVDESLKELERCYKDLGVKGIIMFSNINGKPIASAEFHPFYQMAADYELPILIHPAPPLTLEAMIKNKIPVPLYGFTLDTTMAVVSLIFQGILEKYPRLKLVHPHLGGIVPYLVGRMEDCYRSYAEEFGFELGNTASYYYKRQVYPDSISFHLPAMKCCLEYVGPDHILLGTDYAHPIGNIEDAIDYVKRMDLSEEDTQKILSDNANRLFKLS
ncbi:MAG: amidohydrolase family protein [Dehalococcoidia bacterium]